MERVALKCLPITVVDSGEVPAVVGDPSHIVGFTTWWMFAQQHYLLHDLYGRPPEHLNEVVKLGLEVFASEMSEHS
jgi:hypothetical protein